MTKTLTRLMAGAVVAAFAAAGHAAPLLDFQVLETNVPGTVPHTFFADAIAGVYSQRVTIAAGDTFDTMAYARFTQFYGNDGTSLVSPTQLGGVGGYGMYAVFESSGTVNGGVFSGTSGFFELYIDVNQDTTLALGATGTTPVTVGGNPDDYLIAAGALFNSQANGNSDAQALAFQFGLTSGDQTQAFAGDQNGELYFLSPRPFYPVIRLSANFGIVDSAPGNYFDGGDIFANFDASVVPEPTSFSMVGLALLGICLTRRRKS